MKQGYLVLLADKSPDILTCGAMVSLGGLFCLCGAGGGGGGDRFRGDGDRDTAVPRNASSSSRASSSPSGTKGLHLLSSCKSYASSHWTEDFSPGWLLQPRLILSLALGKKNQD
jgi:hypothetical protein